MKGEQECLGGSVEVQGEGIGVTNSSHRNNR